MMQKFSYRATDRHGATQSGEVEATNLDEARGRLLERGLNVVELTQITAELPPPPLTSEEADQLVQHVSRLTASGFPLGPGLRAAAAESDREAVALGLRTLAERLDRGQPLTSLLEETDTWLPSHVAGLIAAALRTGRLAEALVELVEQQRGARALRQRLRQSLAYPITVTVLAALLLTFIMGFLTSAFERLFRDFNVMLPFATRHLFWWRDTGIWILLACIIVLAAVALLYRRTRGPASWAKVIASLPLFGPLFYFQAIAEWAGLMSLLIRNQVPLPDALRLSADGTKNAWVAQSSRTWANETAMGHKVSDLLSGSQGFPNTLAPLIQWGEKKGALAEAFAAGREVLERRVQLRAEMLRTILPPLLFIGIACCVLLLVVALFLPVASLIHGLS